jgi:hypothetical protein
MRISGTTGATTAGLGGTTGAGATTSGLGGTTGAGTSFASAIARRPSPHIRAKTIKYFTTFPPFFTYFHIIPDTILLHPEAVDYFTQLVTPIFYHHLPESSKLGF